MQALASLTVTKLQTPRKLVLSSDAQHTVPDMQDHVRKDKGHNELIEAMHATPDSPTYNDAISHNAYCLHSRKCMRVQVHRTTPRAVTLTEATWPAPSRCLSACGGARASRTDITRDDAHLCQAGTEQLIGCSTTCHESKVKG